MNDPSAAWPTLLGLAALAVPLSYGVAAALSLRPGSARRASLASGFAFALSLLTFAAWALVSGRPLRVGLVPAGAPLLSLRLDAVGLVALGMIAGLGAVIVRFSRAYLRGEKGHDRYLCWLLATLSASTTFALANHLLVMVIAWVATSLSLHHLLTFFADRPQALVAAHKKFLSSRLAELCLLSGLALLGASSESLEIDALARWAEGPGSLPIAAQIAAVLLVAGVSIKSAQLPFHGWLMQVMEAPTPVSALLHAGVINLGGLFLIRLSPLMSRAPLAQTLLVLVGCTTAVVASLVMTTQSSVKLSLAWSTSAQMGFMLVECGLGAYSLALLHLVAHSLYKAHAFLSSASAVERWRVASMLPRGNSPGLARWLIAALASLSAVGASAWALGLPRDPSLAAFTLVLALSLSPLLVRASQHGLRATALASLAGALVVGLSFGGHALFERLVPSASGQASPLGAALVAASFVALFAAQATLRARPDGRLAAWLRPALAAGLYLDALVTVAAFRLWPPRLPARAERPRSLPLTGTLEA